MNIYKCDKYFIKFLEFNETVPKCTLKSIPILKGQ